MSHVDRIQGPSPSEPSKGKTERSVDSAGFKKYMVEEVDKSDADQRKNQKRNQQEDDDATEIAKQAVNAPEPTLTPPIEKVDSTPSKQQTTSSSQPSTPHAPTSGAHTPLAAFSADEIEDYAWEEDQPAPQSPQSAAQNPQRPPLQSGNQEQQPTPPQYTPPPAAAPPTYTPSEDWGLEQEEELPPPSPRYSTEGSDFEEQPQWQEFPGTFEHPQPSSPTTSSQEQQSQPKSQEKAPPKRKQAPVDTEKKPPASSTKQPQKVIKEESGIELTAPKEKKGRVQAPKKKTSPMLAAEEKRGKKTSAPTDFKKMMSETATKPDEKEPSLKEPKQAPSKEKSGPSSQKKLPLKPSRIPGAQVPGLKAEQVKREAPAEELSEAPLPKGSPLADLASPKKETPGKIAARKSEPKEEAEEIEGSNIPMAMPMQPQSTGDGQAGGDRGKREPKDLSIEELGGTIAGSAMQAGMSVPEEHAPAPLASTSPFADLPLEAQSLIMNMVGVVTVMKTTGITETTVTLNEQKFAGTLLSGASVTIRTYDSAPGQLNIEFSGSTAALLMMQQNLPNLMAAFQTGNYNFTVKRCDFIFHRKESPKGRDGDQGQQGQERRNG